MPHKKKLEKEAVADESAVENGPSIDSGSPQTPNWQAKAKEYLTDLKRCQADFENYKRRQEVQQKELGGYLIEKLVLDIIPVLDNFRSATMHVPAEQKESPWVVGIQYIEKQLETVLTDNGMQTIEAKEGDEFNPTIHEAVGAEQGVGSRVQGIDGDNSEPSDQLPVTSHQIAKVIQKGYRLGDKVIRAARVIVK
jgi:molecular chaperone GrpE